MKDHDPFPAWDEHVGRSKNTRDDTTVNNFGLSYADDGLFGGSGGVGGGAETGDSNNHPVEHYPVGGSEEAGYDADESVISDTQALAPASWFTNRRASSESDESLDDAFYAQVGDENYYSEEDGGEPVRIGVSDETYDSEPEDGPESLATLGTSREQKADFSDSLDHLRNPLPTFTFNEGSTSPTLAGLDTFDFGFQPRTPQRSPPTFTERQNTLSPISQETLSPGHHLRNPLPTFIFEQVPATLPAEHNTYSFSSAYHDASTSIKENTNIAHNNTHNFSLENRLGSRSTSNNKSRATSALSENFKSFLEHQRKSSKSSIAQRYSSSFISHNFPSVESNYESHHTSIENRLPTTARPNHNALAQITEDPTTQRFPSHNMEESNNKSALREYLTKQRGPNNPRVEGASPTPANPAVKRDTTALQEYLKKHKGKDNPGVDRVVAAVAKSEVERGTTAIQEYLNRQKGKHNPRVERAMATLSQPRVKRERQYVKNPNSLENFVLRQIRQSILTIDRITAVRLNDQWNQRSTQVPSSNCNHRGIGVPSKALTTTLDRDMATRLNERQRERFAQAISCNGHSQSMGGPSTALTNTLDRNTAGRMSEQPQQRFLQNNPTNVDFRGGVGPTEALAITPDHNRAAGVNEQHRQRLPQANSSSVRSQDMGGASAAPTARSATARAIRNNDTAEVHNPLGTFIRRPVTALSMAPKVAKQKGKDILKKIQSFFKGKKKADVPTPVRSLTPRERFPLTTFPRVNRSPPPRMFSQNERLSSAPPVPALRTQRSFPPGGTTRTVETTYQGSSSSAFALEMRAYARESAIRNQRLSATPSSL